ncbi:MAG: M20/M25/M40 family metallo-hydrolase [Candidatus Promineifilaceae bacterium]
MNDIARIARTEQVKQAIKFLKDNLSKSLELAVEIQQIPAPTFHEAQRADFIQTHFSDLGLLDVHQDDLHNVFGRYTGTNPDLLPVIVSAHIDTVFSQNTDLAISRTTDQGRPLIFGPGLADNSMGVAGILQVANALRQYDLRPLADIWFVSNVAEEGLGDLKGMRSVVERFGRTTAYIVVEGGSYGHIFHGAIGVRRFQVTFKTDGGHSWGNFGSPNAIHVLGRFIAALDDLVVPRKPKTTYNVGVIEGGTTINSIASEASLLLDLRSAGSAELGDLVAHVEKLAAELNRLSGVRVDMEQIGNRPAGEISAESPLIVWAVQALQEVGCRSYALLSGSTDANIPISQGYPAVCIGLANAGNTHRTDEYLDPTHLADGLTQLLLLTVAAAGHQ